MPSGINAREPGPAYTERNSIMHSLLQAASMAPSLLSRAGGRYRYSGAGFSRADGGPRVASVSLLWGRTRNQPIGGLPIGPIVPLASSARRLGGSALRRAGLAQLSDTQR